MSFLVTAFRAFVMASSNSRYVLAASDACGGYAYAKTLSPSTNNFQSVKNQENKEISTPALPQRQQEASFIPVTLRELKLSMTTVAPAQRFGTKA